MFEWVKKLFHHDDPQIQTTHKWIWDEEIKNILNEKIDVLETASDVKELDQYFLALPHEQKVELFAKLFKWLAYYESSWDPNSQDVDVGEAEDRNTWSIGLLQLSVVDQQNLGIHLDYDFHDLLLPVPNLKLGVEIMCNQVKKRGKLFIPKWEKGNPGVYWATLNPGNIYDKTDKILQKVRE